MDSVTHSRRNDDHAAGQRQITTLELMGLTHALDAEALMVRKCRHYAAEATDGDTQRLFMDQAAAHQRHFDQLLSLTDTTDEPTQRAERIVDMDSPV